MRQAARTDATQAEIVAAFRGLGCLVVILAGVGQGCPDLLCCFRKRLFLVECKTGSGWKLTKEQIEFHRVWPVFVVASVVEVLQTLRAFGSDVEVTAGGKQ